uniref:Amidase domain-containing protein n=1 Tax=Rhabditophanes sp. KR3021 TaxID=114890 RepID=A0AC35TJR0_9BILA
MVLLFPFIKTIDVDHYNVFFKTLIYVIHVLYCFLVNTVFAFINNFTPRKCVPKIKNALLLKSATDCASLIRKGELTSFDLVSAYIERQKEVHPLINAVAYDNYEYALRKAAKIDNYLAQLDRHSSEFENLSTTKPFLGIPFTVKSSICVKNCKAIAGIVCRMNLEPCTQEHDGITNLKEAGAIPLSFTNVPTMCLWVESHNYVSGRTSNPYDIRRTCGGSSGGEGSVIGAGGSLFGIGSDLGGSIRIPASLCGVFGFKCSPNALPDNFHIPDGGKDLRHMAHLGPLARYATDLKEVTKFYCNDEQRKNLRLDEPTNMQELKYFYIDDISYLDAEPIANECRAVVHDVANELSKTNVTTQVKIDEFKYSCDFWFAQYQKAVDSKFDGLNGYLNNFDPNEALSVPYEMVKNILGFKTDFDLGALSLSFDIKHVKSFNEKYLNLYLEKFEAFRTKLIKMLSNDGVLILPAWPTAAPFHRELLFNRANLSYTAVFNALGFPVISCPIALNKNGLPLNVQIVAVPNNDKILFDVAIEIEKIFGGWKEAI